MKKILFVLALLSALFAHAQQNHKETVSYKRLKNDTIVWRKDSLLTKEDFKARHGGRSAGFASVGIFLNPKESGGTIVFDVEATFLKSKSFLAENSPYTLEHEQLHFDICEIFARKLRKMMMDKDFKKVRDIRGEIQKMYNKVSAEMYKEENKYDDDTEHGLNPAKQKVWDADIAQQLKDLDSYSNITVNITQ